jgi:hypothetical protein
MDRHHEYIVWAGTSAESQSISELEMKPILYLGVEPMNLKTNRCCT